jgi:hypothetical protein
MICWVVNEAERFAIQTGWASERAMNQSFPRAAAFAVLSMILLAALSAVAFFFLLGVPKGPGAAVEFQAEAARMAPTIDLVLGGLVLLVCAWLAARPFAGRDAIKTGLIVGVIYLIFDLIIIIVFGDVRQIALGTTGVSYAVKLGAALLGGALAARTPSRSPESATLDEQ